MKIAKGTLQTTHKLQRSRKYTIKNSGEKAKKILVEYPLDPAWKLVAPQKPDETARDRYRFAVAAEPGTCMKQEVKGGPPAGRAICLDS
jgi:hypothetical protein